MSIEYGWNFPTGTRKVSVKSHKNSTFSHFAGGGWEVGGGGGGAFVFLCLKEREIGVQRKQYSLTRSAYTLTAGSNGPKQYLCDINMQGGVVNMWNEPFLFYMLITPNKAIRRSLVQKKIELTIFPKFLHFKTGQFDPQHNRRIKLNYLSSSFNLYIATSSCWCT